MAPRATFSKNVSQLPEEPQKFVKTVFQLSNCSKNVILAWFFVKEVLSKTFKYSLGFQNSSLTWS